ncbi:hypothetical protein Pint_05713 [Pistacia integerrima]|uniref:Uncharacterized protein n=1 Tax=Pistacia integerrima TaxID=434235 RepID=A0ACC0Z579_9ROSI|nr:hypothetical protein Pint_05713 [Pistacia integerrima]
MRSNLARSTARRSRSNKTSLKRPPRNSTRPEIFVVRPFLALVGYDQAEIASPRMPKAGNGLRRNCSRPFSASNDCHEKWVCCNFSLGVRCNEALNSDISAAYAADKDRKMTPLHMAVSNAFALRIACLPKKRYVHMQIIEEIISQCPDCCQMVDDRGWNVLHFAMTMLPVQQLNTLLENPILRDLVTKKDARGNTPLHVLAACRPREYHRIKKKLEGTRYHYAVNKQNDTIHDIIFFGSPQLQKEIQELSSSDGTGPYWRGVIIENPFWIFTKLPRFEKTKDSELVVATLIATVTFTAALTMPGGYRSEKGPDQGTAFLSRKAAFQAFVITDATAFVLSLAAVFLHFATAWNLSALWFFRAYTRLLISLAIVAMVVAFSTGTYAVLSPSLGFAIATCLIGLSFFLGIFTLIYLRESWRRRILKKYEGKRRSQ